MTGLPERRRGPERRVTRELPELAAGFDAVYLPAVVDGYNDFDTRSAPSEGDALRAMKEFLGDIQRQGAEIVSILPVQVLLPTDGSLTEIPRTATRRMAVTRKLPSSQ